MPNHDRPLLAVLIDADNVPARHAAKIMNEIASIGEPALRRVYGDWSNEHLKSWREPIHTLGLVIHAMDILHSGKFDAFVIVSSDSDFTALVNRLREDGLTVIGIGEEKTNPALRNVYNRFILVENLKDENESNDTAAKPKADMNHAYQLICNAIARCETEDEWVPLGSVGKNLMAAHPDFDTRSYGFAKLSGLIKALPKLKFANDGNRPLVHLKT